MTALISRGARHRRRPGGPRRWTAADKTAHLTAFAARGGTIAAYCAATDVPRATFTLWQREARVAAGTARPARRPRPTFARVEVVAPPLAPAFTLVVRRGADLAAEVTGLGVATLAVLLPALFGDREA
jgi:transposase-like protein